MSQRLPANTGSPRCLFVLCNDYGELGVAMYALAGQPLADRATLLLSPRLSATNRDGLPAPVETYHGLSDLLKAVDRHQPDVVLLLSGYLLSLHRNLSLRELEAFVGALQRRGIKIVTSDPFFGLVADADPNDAFRIEIPRSSWVLRLVARQQTRKLIRHLKRSRAILRDVPHLYPVYPEANGPVGTAPRISFYNDRLVAEPPPSPPGRRSWLFILGAHDYELQLSIHGDAEFNRRLQQRLEDARDAGRRAIFIGPERCVRQLGVGGVKGGLDLVSFCPYGTFTSLLLAAEYAFYWNVVSYSNLLRLVNGLPLFSFDLGHLVRNVKPLYPRLVDWYYQGTEPVVLDSQDTLEPSRLAILAARSADGRKYRERLGRSPGPEPMLRQVLCG